MNHTRKFLTESVGQSELPKISIGKHAFNLSLCLFEPKMINSVLSGLNLSLLVDIHFLTASKHLFNFSKAADAFFTLLYVLASENYHVMGSCHINSQNRYVLIIVDQARALTEHTPMLRHVMTSKWEYPDYFYIHTAIQIAIKL